MPITTSAKKAMRQARTRTARNRPYQSQVKSVIKKVLELAKTDQAAAAKELNTAYKVIDLASKKHLLHKNNASRKKSRLARAVATGGKGVEVAAKKPKKAKAAAKK